MILDTLDANVKLPHYNVSAGLIRNNDKILITQRLSDDKFGGLWEFPGGKQKPGETLEQCLTREINEELNIQIQVNKKFMTVSHDYDEVQITLHIFQCTFLDGIPEKKGVQDWRWVDLAEFDQYDFTEADKLVIKRLKA
jgi:mutator protein MutT